MNKANEKKLKKPIDGNNQVKSDKKDIEQKKTSGLKNTVNTPYKEKKNIESHTKTYSNLLTKNTELVSNKRKAEDYSKALRQKKILPKKKTTKNQLPKKTINNSISSNNNENSQLTGSVQGEQKGKEEDYSNTIGQNNFPKTNTTNQLPKITINNESSQLTRSVQGKPRFSLIKTTV